MKDSLSTLIQSRNKPLVFDGGMGTSLKATGIEIGCLDELCNLCNPVIVADIHRNFIKAGAHVISTNTFQANSLVLKKNSVDEVNSKGVKIAREVADSFDSKILVGGSMGPLWIPRVEDRSNSANKLYEAACRQDIYFEQAAVLAESGVDFLILETNFRLDEALVMLEAVKKTGLECVVTMAFIEGSDGTPLTPAGDSVESVVNSLEAAGASVIGANCCNGVDFTTNVASIFSEFASLPLLFQPNAGLPLKGHYPEGPSMFGTFARDMVRFGVSAVGGCCGTDCSHIQAMSDALEKG